MNRQQKSSMICITKRLYFKDERDSVFKPFLLLVLNFGELFLLQMQIGPRWTVIVPQNFRFM